jgi:hypothetical protein
VLHRPLAIILCFSLIGVTVIPAAYVPCCCKTSCKTVLSKQARSCCNSGATVVPAVRAEAKSRPCCGMAAQAMPVAGTCPYSESEEACPNKVVKQECPVCRCLEQMQIVALSSGSALSETFTKVTFAAWAPATAFQLVPAPNFGEIVSVGQEHLSSINLLTCSMRC